jgi:hypothetical protein
MTSKSTEDLDIYITVTTASHVEVCGMKINVVIQLNAPLFLSELGYAERNGLV